mmetsp:Transcript_46076/g.108598  ORF Transcript_46076/g.108598 Transcript_46076/m.108598 type:complete len:250 (-) Transcript_46076:106-855(-)
MSHKVSQLLGERGPSGCGAVRNLIADGPYKDGRVVAVSLHHRGEVTSPPLLKGKVVIVRVLPDVPAVERLVHNDDPQSVRSIEKRRARWVVGGADRVVPVGLHQRHLALLRLVVGCCPQRAIVVVHAAATELHHLAVELETVRDIPLDGAETIGRGHGVGGVVAKVGDGGRTGVQMRCLRTPELRVAGAQHEIGRSVAPTRDGDQGSSCVWLCGGRCGGDTELIGTRAGFVVFHRDREGDELLAGVRVD